MVSGVSSPSGDLNQLRQQYDRLCDLMTRAAESDAATAERVLDELEAVSERILVLEAAEDAGSAESSDTPADTAEPQPPEPAVEASSPPGPARPAGEPRIVSFRVTPVTGATGASPPAKPSWRVDARPQAPDAEPQPRAAEAGPSAAPEAEPRRSDTPTQPAPTADRSAGRGNATVFSAAIRQWLERHRKPDETPSADQESPPPAKSEPALAPERGNDRQPVSVGSVRMAAAIEQQAAQIDRIMRLCEEHQAALEALRNQIEERLEAPRHAPPGSGEAPSLEELSLAIGEQRSRITALAKTIHDLAEWLAAHQFAPDR